MPGATEPRANPRLTDGPAGWPASRAAGTEPGRPLRVVIGLGDAERERRALTTLTEANGFAVVGRCLSADDLLPRLAGQVVDAVLVAADLHHLEPRLLQEAQRRAGRVVVLIPDRRGETSWRELGLPVLAVDAPPSTLVAVLRGARGTPPTPEVGEASVPAAGPEPSFVTESLLLAVTGGGGSPGRTTVAVNLALGLASVAPTVLVDADLSSPMAAAYLAADTTLNLSMVAYAAPRNSTEWDRALSQEVQPLSPFTPRGAVLCGVPKREMRGRVSPRFFAELLHELSQRYRYVIVDAGGELGADSDEVGRLAVDAAGLVLLVATPNLVGLAHARRALEQMGFKDGAVDERVAVVVNRHSRRHHGNRQTLEFTLGAPLAAIVPYDYDAAERALHEQRPLVLDGRSRAGRAVLAFAGRLHGGAIRLPAETPRPSKRARVQHAGGMRAVFHRLPLQAVSQAAVVSRRLPGLHARAKARAPKTMTEEGATDGQLAGAG